MTFDFIYEKYFDEIYRYCFYRNDNDKYCAEEATKLTFDVVWRDWETVKTYPSDRFTAWLYGVAENKIKEVRREQPLSTESLDEEWCRALIDEENIFKEPPDPDEEFLHFIHYVRKIRFRLKPKEWQLFRLRVLKRLSHREVGERLGLNENSAKLRWARLQNKLEPIIEEILKNK